MGRNIAWLMRLAMRLMPAAKIPKDIVVNHIFAPAPDRRAKIRLRLYRPRAASEKLPVLLWFHGGGHLIGRPEQDDLLCAQYAQEAGIVVISVDYRLAPQNPFPAALDDAYAALTFIYAKAGALAIDATRLAIGGASAGAGLAASLSQLAHDRQQIKPVFQLLVYPMLDDRTALRADPGHPDHIAWNRASNRYAWGAYLGRHFGAADMPDYAAPARRRDLSGLPPAWIGVGSEDLFLAEDIAYARALEAAGVACETMIVPGAFHGFDIFAAAQPVAQNFRAAQITALKTACHPKT
jgi:acetyl esterase/lipase